MTKRLLLAFATVALAMASAKTYDVTLFQPAMLSGKELRAGGYKVEVTGDKLVMRNGRDTTEAAVKVETVEQKYPTTSVRYAVTGGTNSIQEIRLGGTKMKVVVSN